MAATQADDARILRVEGRAVVLRGNDIDTDRIMPARFLRAVSFDGLERHLFEDDRAAAGSPPHPLDAPGAVGASVLVVNRNFGCGSSREHAPQAIARRGFRAVVGESFAEIFFSNATALGMPCVTAPRDVVEALMAACERTPSLVLGIDFEAMTVRAGAHSWPLTMPAPAREAFLAGTWDATALLTAEFDVVRAVEARLPYRLSAKA